MQPAEVQPAEVQPTQFEVEETSYIPSLPVARTQTESDIKDLPEENYQIEQDSKKVEARSSVGTRAQGSSGKKKKSEAKLSRISQLRQDLLEKYKDINRLKGVENSFVWHASREGVRQKSEQNTRKQQKELDWEQKQYMKSIHLEEERKKQEKKLENDHKEFKQGLRSKTNKKFKDNLNESYIAYCDTYASKYVTPIFVPSRRTTTWTSRASRRGRSAHSSSSTSRQSLKGRKWNKSCVSTSRRSRSTRKPVPSETNEC